MRKINLFQGKCYFKDGRELEYKVFFGPNLIIQTVLIGEFQSDFVSITSLCSIQRAC